MTDRPESQPAPLPPPPTREELDALLAPLSAGDRAIVLQEFDRVAARPAETDLASYGCLGSFVGLALLIAIPNLVRFVSLPRTARLVLISLAIMLIVSGLVTRALIPTKRVRDAGRRAKTAIDALASLDYSADPARWFREASIVMIDAFYSGGPWTVHTFDFAQARKRLGPALPRVIAVETLIRLERGIYPVFTTFPSPPRESDRTADS
jgi:hypothetical protein